jgi:hypothetical protein
VNIEEVDELFKAFNDAGITLGFGRDSCTNIPNPFDPDDTGWHFMIHDESLFEGKEGVFKRILEERGLEWKPEEFLGWTHISIYRPGYRFPGWKSHGYKA